MITSLTDFVKPSTLCYRNDYSKMDPSVSSSCSVVDPNIYYTCHKQFVLLDALLDSPTGYFHFGDVKPSAKRRFRIEPYAKSSGNPWRNPFRFLDKIPSESLEKCRKILPAQKSKISRAGGYVE